ncbi:unnamed protein product [Dracunculus medinensis]|uniref:G protein gamma domain-containing protein n=1 Tax=Dracunculus medinensis TaxID=318479 RepID=A0A0N4UPG1_DRAME|nr:unnamed protein product [Dracunculus medinensis]
MEHEQSELNRRISQLEISVKRANEAKIAAQDNLQKIQQIPELSETPGRRARSASPGCY